MVFDGLDTEDVAVVEWHIYTYMLYIYLPIVEYSIIYTNAIHIYILYLYIHIYIYVQHICMF